jgi:hypothetical protein
VKNEAVDAAAIISGDIIYTKELIDYFKLFAKSITLLSNLIEQF